jgi:GTPase SAR1 family protein
MADVPIPKIAMIGDQRSGKSSLVEALSDIKVPRNSGTCTRCLMEINLIKDLKVEFKAKVSIRKPYMYGFIEDVDEEQPFWP